MTTAYLKKVYESLLEIRSNKDIAEIEALRQRVKELEDGFNSANELAKRNGLELLALKQAQGDPVAVVNVQGGGANPVFSWLRTIHLQAGTHMLYTSAKGQA